MTEKHIRHQFKGRFAAQSQPVVSNKSTKWLFATCLVAGLGVVAGAPAQQPNYPAPSGGFNAPTQQLQLPQLPVRQAITPNGTVVEDVIARVNDQIITRSEYERSEQQLVQEAQQANVSQADVDERLHNLLRDMIDQQLLLSKGKELGITGDAETIRELDDLRKQNHMDTLEQLEKAATDQGISFEDFKRSMRDRAITQQVVRDEVGRRLNMTRGQEEAYYKAHAKEFEVPEQVHLSEILIPTPENATDADIAAAQAKADALSAKLKAGAVFADLARSDSGGPTASAGGDLGDFKRGALGSEVLENAVFPLPVGGNTAPIRTRQGFVILHVDAHQQAGVPPLAAVEDQVQQAIYIEQMQPALRAYLTKAREDAYVEIAPGFVDSGSIKKTAKADITYTAYAAPAIKKKVQVKQRVEQEKANKAQADLAAAREKVAQKQAAKAAENVGTKSTSAKMKPKKIRREKIRYGQAPRDSLPAGIAQTSDASSGAGAPIAGQAAGVAMAPTESVTSITTGTGVDADTDALAPESGPQKKTRFSAHETQAEMDAAKAKLVKAEAKASTRPTAATQQETASEKQQAAPLGLNGDTTKKQKKPKHKKGDPKERLREKPKTDDTPTPVDPTVNPALASKPTTATTPPPATTSTPAPQQ